jgi:hypothetical protein
MADELLAARHSPLTTLFASYGAIAQLGERLLCKQEVVGSIPSGSTSGFGFVQEVTRFAASNG